MVLAGCASKSTPSPSPEPTTDPCLLVTPPAEPLDTFTIALPEPIDLSDAHARHPGNDSERLLFRNLYRNLVRLDCQGQLRPGLVETWTQDSDSTWTVSLSDDDGFGSDAQRSVAYLISTLSPAGGGGVAGIDSAVALSDRQVRVFSTSSPDSVLRILAAPEFAIVEGMPSDSRSVKEASIEIPGRGALPVLELKFPLQGDARDALDRGADLIVTRDAALLEYAGRRPDITVHPLPWSRTYVLIQPSAAPSLTVGSTDPERQSLARDAVHADARSAEPPFWWLESSCATAGRAALPSTSDRIVYPRDDAVARSLAERLVALAGPGDRMRAVGLDRSQMTSALRQGTERAFVISLPRQPLQPCTELGNIPAGARVRPLIDTRAHAIVRQGAPPLSIEWDGTIRVVRP